MTGSSKRFVKTGNSKTPLQANFFDISLHSEENVYTNVKCHYLVFILLVKLGDIAFRFLKFVENEESFRALHSGARFDIDVAAEVRAEFTLT